MDTYRLVYPNGVVVDVKANSWEEAADIGFAFGADLKDETPEVSKETKQAA